jgi:hypothetical protein
VDTGIWKVSVSLWPGASSTPCVRNKRTTTTTPFFQSLSPTRTFVPSPSCQPMKSIFYRKVECDREKSPLR